ncbi:MAG TPA: [Fe-Fe] hydrogenase large subunit C-terminal domain-containing protein [Ruminiclostridium sp.]|nr:[Fe-Fe] hydrogenase large subunit C-terminal domain-containing protein [Ruminiclostridium sp.]
MGDFYHSVTLDSSRCKGCINCIKRCPTEAIRVRNGKAYIIPERCIDCGECIRVCPQHAKKAVFDSLESLKEFKWKIAMPAPALYGQFNNIDNIDKVLTAFKRIGFDDIFEVSAAAEVVSECTRKMMSGDNLPRPVISSACPAVTRLIRVRFPNLCRNVLPVLAPVEIAAQMARRDAMQKTGLKENDIGVFFISPCPAKVTYVRTPLGTRKSAIDYVLAISDIYPKIAGIIKHMDDPEPLSHSGIIGVGWAGSGGEASALLNEKYLAADGIENVIKVLEEIEDEKLGEVDFIELNACSGGCVGGALTIENPYIAKARLQRLRKYLPVACNHINGIVPASVMWTLPLEYMPVLKLDNDVSVAMKKLMAIDALLDEMPGLDCGSCGAPSCRAFCEDVIRGMADKGDCIFKLRERINKLVDELSLLEGYLPPPFRKPDTDPEQK